MTVYIEYVILDNFSFTFLICYLSYKILREKVLWHRCAIASAVGTACAIAYPFVKNIALVILFKVVLYIVMCLILYIKLKKFFTRSAVFLLATALVGGIQFMIGFAVYGNASAALRLPVSELPLSIFFLPPIILFVILRKVFSVINAHRLRQNYSYDVKLTIYDKSLVLKGLIDTGNTVKADKDVIFIGRMTALELLGAGYLNLLGNEANRATIYTASGSKKIILLPAKIELYLSKDEHIFMDVQVGISDVMGKNEAILPLSILGKEKAL